MYPVPFCDHPDVAGCPVFLCLCVCDDCLMVARAAQDAFESSNITSIPF